MRRAPKTDPLLRILVNKGPRALTLDPHRLATTASKTSAELLVVFFFMNFW